MINCDFSFLVPDNSTFDAFSRYMIGRVDRALTVMEALIKGAIPKMRRGGRIILLTNSLWMLAVTEASYSEDHPLVARNQALSRRAQEVCFPQ